MIDTTLARRYARALVEIGRENDSLERYGKDLEAIVEVFTTSRDFREVLVNPVFPKDDKISIARNVLTKMDVDQMVRNFIFLLIDRKRIDQLEGIERAYREKVDEINGITRAEVVSAASLDEDELGRITEALSRISGKKAIVSPRVDASLIGGLVAKVGDKVFDGTIRTQLNQLKESLKG